jgi:hypothetical protein
MKHSFFVSRSHVGTACVFIYLFTYLLYLRSAYKLHGKQRHCALLLVCFARKQRGGRLAAKTAVLIRTAVVRDAQFGT